MLSTAFAVVVVVVPVVIQQIPALLLPRQPPPAVADAVLVGGLVLPHGDFALDPTFFEDGTKERRAANKVARGSRRVARWLWKQQWKQQQQQQQQQQHRDEPLVVLLTTPHGLKLDYNHGIYIGSKGSGTATIGGDCWQQQSDKGFSHHHHHHKPSVSVSTNNNNNNNHCQRLPYNLTLEDVPLAPTALTEDLLETLSRDKHHPVSGIYSYDADTPIPLNWGELVPLSIVWDAYEYDRNRNRNRNHEPHHPRPSPPTLLPLVWSFPERRYDHAAEMVPELLAIGADLAEWIRNRPEPIAVLVSGDLSHTHRADGPYGYSDASAKYDRAIDRWAHNPCQSRGDGDGDALLELAKTLQPDAKSCGFTGFVLWHGIMCSSSSNGSNTGKTSRKFGSKVLVNRNVTYYGMMAASFTPLDEGRLELTATQ
eukprot:jgi/Psemu1/258864/estExt_Genewise1Plus.C_3080019